MDTATWTMTFAGESVELTDSQARRLRFMLEDTHADFDVYWEREGQDDLRIPAGRRSEVALTQN